MSHPDNSQQIDLVRHYIADVEAVVNHLGIIPRDKFIYVFDSIALEILSKSFALSKGALSLLDSGFPDEAYGLIRSLVECALSLRYLTQDLGQLDKRTDEFKNHEMLEKQYWLAHALDQFKGKPEEQELNDYAKQLGIEPDKKAAVRHWSGIRGYAWQMISNPHPLDVAGLTEQHKSASYAVDYHQTSSFVHLFLACTQQLFSEGGD